MMASVFKMCFKNHVVYSSLKIIMNYINNNNKRNLSSLADTDKHAEIAHDGSN